MKDKDGTYLTQLQAMVKYHPSKGYDLKLSNTALSKTCLKEHYGAETRDKTIPEECIIPSYVRKHDG